MNEREDNILIVGGAGYIGSHTNKELNKRGYKTIVYDNLIYGHKEFVKWGEFFLGDLANIDQIRLLFSNYDIKAVMHFSAFAYAGESMKDPQKYYLNNVNSTLNLLQVMLEFNVKYFIFSSSCATYGEPETVPIFETQQQLPVNPYGRSKLMIENIIEDYDRAYGLKYVSLRYFNAAGADPDSEIGEWHLPETHLIPLILDVALKKRGAIKIFGTDYDTSDGTCIRDYIHVTDLAVAHILAFEYLINGNSSNSFNLGSGRGYSVKEVIEKAVSITDKKIDIINDKRRPGDPAVLISAAEKAGKILGWRPKYDDLDAILETAWGWHKRI